MNTKTDPFFQMPTIMTNMPSLIKTGLIGTSAHTGKYTGFKFHFFIICFFRIQPCHIGCRRNTLDGSDDVNLPKEWVTSLNIPKLCTRISRLSLYCNFSTDVSTAFVSNRFTYSPIDLIIGLDDFYDSRMPILYTSVTALTFVHDIRHAQFL